MNREAIPPCPVCHTGRHANTHGKDEFFCAKCGGLYDRDPEEGGTYSDHNPAARMEREERARKRQTVTRSR